jgi:hypothetical protein
MRSFYYLLFGMCFSHTIYAQPALDTAVIKKVTGINGVSNKGEYKITIPQNKLAVIVDSFRIIPSMGLATWIGFTPTSQGAMIMGDIVITEKDLKPVQQEVIAQGLTITAIHNHFVRNHPNVMYMHIGGTGATEVMAQKVRAILNKVSQSRGGNPAEGSVDAVTNTIDTAMLVSVVGYRGEMKKGVFKQTIGRPECRLLLSWDSIPGLPGREHQNGPPSRVILQCLKMKLQLL